MTAKVGSPSSLAEKPDLSIRSDARLSVVVLTQNVEDIIRDCLESATWADEIVVVDGGSRDHTVSICREFTDRVIERPWPGVSNLQWIAGIAQAREPWVLLLASDARVQQEGQAEIRDAIASGQHAGYHLPLKNHFLNRWIQHCGWWPDYHVLLIRKDRSSMEPREHGEVKVDGSIGYLRVPIIHYAHRSVSEYVRKTNRYTDAEMRDWAPSERPFRPRFVVTKMVRNFKKTYWKQQGYRDGMYGLVFCGLMAFYKFLLYAKYWEWQQRGASRDARASGVSTTATDEAMERLSPYVEAQDHHTALTAKALLEARGVMPLSEVRHRLTREPLKTFWESYVRHRQFRQGVSGLIRSMLLAWVRFLTWAKYWEMAHVNGLEAQESLQQGAERGLDGSVFRRERTKEQTAP